MKALHAVDRATPRKKVVVRTFGVSLAALKRWLKRRREGEEYLRAKPSPGRTPRILSTLQQRRTLLTTTPGERRRYPTGGLLKWDLWARIDRNRLLRPHKYASIGTQIRLSRVAIGPPPRHQQTTATAFLEKGEPFRERRPQHSISTTGLAPCASQPVGPSSLKTALERHCQMWEEAGGVRVSVATMSRAVRKLGWSF